MRRRRQRPGHEGPGLGLVGMRERAMALGGQLDVIDARGNPGFRLRAVIPFGGAAGTQ